VKFLQERLRKERNREYNEFKKRKENQEEVYRRSKGSLSHRMPTKATAIYLPPNVPSEHATNVRLYMHL